VRAKGPALLCCEEARGVAGRSGALSRYVDMYAKVSGSLYPTIPVTEPFGLASGPFSSQTKLSERGFRTFNKVDIDILNKTTYSLWLNFAILRVALSKKWLLRS
jgi:hypothetical protein